MLVAALGDERSKGTLEGKLEALLAVLEARGLTPTEQERQLLVAERNPLRLDAWLKAGVSCARVAELIEL
ncbi:MAG TPA: hypothetical protein VJN18_26735 [Polyangiaceae bacterium]|nr:hypothetical protein [Polyangiaceae bacterium]